MEEPRKSAVALEAPRLLARATLDTPLPIVDTPLAIVDTPLAIVDKLPGIEGEPRGVEGRLRGVEGEPRGVEGKLRGVEGEPRGIEGKSRGVEGEGLESLDEAARVGAAVVDGEEAYGSHADVERVHPAEQADR